MEPPPDFPQAVVSRIVKSKLPSGAILSKDALKLINRAAVVYTLYLGTCALEESISHNRQTITTNDVYEGLEHALFPEFVVDVQDAVERKRSAKQLKDGVNSNELDAAEGDEAEELEMEEEVAEEDEDVDMEEE